MRDRYGITALHDAGHTGESVSAAVLSVDAYDVRCDRAVDVVPSSVDPPDIAVAEVPGEPSGDPPSELDLDLATLVAGLPGTGRIDVVELDPLAWVGAPFVTVSGGDGAATRSRLHQHRILRDRRDRRRGRAHGVAPRVDGRHRPDRGGRLG
ncbi:MAG: hypothetical protein U5R31_14995 [Acidimicrobiia bacterium]|nr:hypothetical protein [Acidimicrobiia bacterium]